MQPAAARAWMADKGRRIAATPAAEMRQVARLLPLHADTVLYESFAGNGALCHPEAIFRRLVDDPHYAHLQHVWAISEAAWPSPLAEEFRRHPRVRMVKRLGLAYTRHLGTAKYLVNNATFPSWFSKREGQVYLNTWHGTPLKAMGFDEPDGIQAASNVLRNFLMSDFLISGSPWMTARMYEGAYRLTNIVRHLRVIEEGNPRTDRTFLDDAARASVRAALTDAGLHLPSGARLVLYAPTWRGRVFQEPVVEASHLADDVRALQSRLGADDVVLLKVHQQAFETVSQISGLSSVLVPNDVPTNEVLGVCDVLITDYSSIFFDALPTGLPIIFYTPDLDHYASTRGLYVAASDLPGPLTQDREQVVRLVTATGTGAADDPLVTHAEAYRQARETFAPKDDGHATRRVIDVVFGGKREGYAVRPLAQDARPRILIYLGGLKSNGITTSAMNLLRSIDHSRFDVTAFIGAVGRRGERRANADLIDERVRVISRIGGLSSLKLHWMLRRRFFASGAAVSEKQRRTMLGLLREEWRRCFGHAEFDYVVDFSGYSAFFSFLMAEAPAHSRSVWLHNDLLADAMREIDGTRPHEMNLRGVFASYTFFDHLVSVSEALRDINAARLAQHAPAERFSWARNTIDATRIAEAPVPDPELVASFPTDPELQPGAFPTQRELDEQDLTLDHVVQAAYLDRDLEHLIPEFHRRHAVACSPRVPGATQFVTVGRLSPEKNHERLLHAFAAVHADHPQTRLVVIGGGPLQERLEALAVELGLGEAVVITGPLRNPWALMAECDVFVLSSDYEGQPMVILEARVLGLPVVSTRFGSVQGSLEPGVGLVVDRSVEALAEGMTVALRGEVPSPPFDPAAYNAAAVEDFYRAIGA